MPSNLSQDTINAIVNGLIEQSSTRIDTVRMHIFSTVIASAIANNVQLNIDQVKQILRKSHQAAQVYEAWVKRIEEI